MRVLLSTYDSRGGVEPLVALAVRLQQLGAEARVCAPPDEEFAARLDGVGVPLVPFGQSVRAVVIGAPTEADLRRHVDELIAEQFDTVAAAAEDCDVLVATGLVWTAAGARSAADKLGIGYVYASYHPNFLPSPYHPPPTYPGWPLIGNQVLWDMDAHNTNALFGETINGHRASIGLPPLNNVRDYAFTENPWLAADPTLGPWEEPTDLGVVQTGAWLLADDRALPAEVEEFLDAGPPPVYVGFGSMTMPGSKDIGGMAIESIRALGHRAILHTGWADLALAVDLPDCCAVGEVNQQALFARAAAVIHHGGAGTTTTAALAGAPQLVIPQGADQLFWAGRVAGLGIGTAYDGRTATSETLSAAIEAALSPEVGARADDVSGVIRTDGTTVAANLLLDAVGG